MEDIKLRPSRAKKRKGPSISEIEAELLKYFFPLTQTRPQKETTINFIANQIFNCETRRILTYVAMRDFKLAGDRRIEFGEKSVVRMSADRFVKAGELLLVRVDDKMPNRIDVEVVRKGVLTTVYSLDWQQWARSQVFIKKVIDD